MITQLFFLTISYFFSSIQFLQLSSYRMPHNIFGKAIIKNIHFIKHKYPNFSIQTILYVLDNFKSPFFTALSWFFFYDKTITTLTAILTQTASYYSIYYGFIGQRIHFVSFLIAGFVVNPITGIFMIIAFVLAKKKIGYKSIAILSAVITGMIKTLTSVVILKNTNYLEFFFFTSFGLCIIYNNKKILLYICSKNLPQHQNIKRNNPACNTQILKNNTWISNKIGFFRKKQNSNHSSSFVVKQQVNTQTKQNSNNKRLKNNSAKYKKKFFKNFKKFLKNNPQSVEEDDKYYLR